MTKKKGEQPLPKGRKRPPPPPAPPSKISELPASTNTSERLVVSSGSEDYRWGIWNPDTKRSMSNLRALDLPEQFVPNPKVDSPQSIEDWHRQSWFEPYEVFNGQTTASQDRAMVALEAIRKLQGCKNCHLVEVRRTTKITKRHLEEEATPAKVGALYKQARSTANWLREQGLHHAAGVMEELAERNYRLELLAVRKGSDKPTRVRNKLAAHMQEMRDLDSAGHIVPQAMWDKCDRLLGQFIESVTGEKKP